MEPHEYDEMLRTLVRITARQDLINEDIRASLAAQREINERLAAAIERLETTQARIETLLARIIPQGENDREA